MENSKVASDPNRTAKAQIVSALQDRLSLQAACALANTQRRTLHNWRKADQRFDAACIAAIEDAKHLVSKRKVAQWRDELGALLTELGEIESNLGEVSALAMAGDSDAIARRDELRARHRTILETAEALRQAIASGEGHIARQAEAKVEAERQTAANQSDELAQQQRTAAAKIDLAIAQVESAWIAFDLASKAR